METALEHMSKYSIRDLENLSGIKAHTIRIWEQRYNIIHPKRTSTNIRYYSPSDLKLILKISRLRESGIKISKIASMSPEEINQHILDLDSTTSEGVAKHIHFLTTAMLDLYEGLFERTLSTCILQLGLEATMFQIIYPFLIKIGSLWQTEAINPAQEHFISCLLRQKLIVAIDGQKLVENNQAKRFLLFLPEGELHEISLLFSSYLLKKNGCQVIYLGQNLPFADVLTAYQIHKPQYLLSVSTSFPVKLQLQQYVDDLASNMPAATIFLSGFAVLNADLNLPENVKILSHMEDLLVVI